MYKSVCLKMESKEAKKDILKPKKSLKIYNILQCDFIEWSMVWLGVERFNKIIWFGYHFLVVCKPTKTRLFTSKTMWPNLRLGSIRFWIWFVRWLTKRFDEFISWSTDSRFRNILWIIASFGGITVDWFMSPAVIVSMIAPTMSMVSMIMPSMVMVTVMVSVIMSMMVTLQCQSEKNIRFWKEKETN